MAYAGYDRHDGDVNIATCDGKYVVTADRYKAVVKLQDKTCRAQTDKILGVTKSEAFPQKTYF